MRIEGTGSFRALEVELLAPEPPHWLPALARAPPTPQALRVLHGQAKVLSLSTMSAVAEVEAAIERPPLTEMENAAEWLETRVLRKCQNFAYTYRMDTRYGH